MKISRTRMGGTATSIGSNVGPGRIRTSVFRWTILLKSIFDHEWKINPPQLFTNHQSVWISGSTSANWPWCAWFKSGVRWSLQGYATCRRYSVGAYEIRAICVRSLISWLIFLLWGIKFQKKRGGNFLLAYFWFFWPFWRFQPFLAKTAEKKQKKTRKNLPPPIFYKVIP